MVINDENKKTFRFVKNVVKYLSKSGLWENVRKDFEKLLALPYEDFIKYINMSYSEQRKFEEELNIGHYVDNIKVSALKGIKAINYEKQDREYYKEIVKEKIQKNETYSIYWRKSYDNRFLLKDNKAWYSEEYKGCVNGYYYLALDESHAMFCEKD